MSGDTWHDHVDTTWHLGKWIHGMMCHAPSPVPPRRSEREVRDCIGTLYFLFSDIGGPKSYNCIKISYTKIQIKTTIVVVFTVSYKYSPESHLHIQKLYIYIYKSEHGTYMW